MEEEILKSIDTKLAAIIRLLASGSIQGKKKTEAIITLGSLGLDAALIAELVGTTPATVFTRLSEIKRKSKVESKKILKKAETK